MKTKVEYEATAMWLVDGSTPRRCERCTSPATLAVYRAVKGRPLDCSSRRMACEEHANLSLWPEAPVRSRNVISLPHAHRGVVPQERDNSLFYRDIVREMGGEVPMPDKVTKEELALAGKRLARRHNNWPVAGVPGERFVKPYQRRYRPAGMSGRQWIRMRREMGLARTAR